MLRGDIMLIAITHFKILISKDIIHFNTISSCIDYLLLRTPMSDNELSSFLCQLIHSGFPKEKIIIHTSTELLESFRLTAIHFRENDPTALTYKKEHPDISVSMSAHSPESVKKAQDNHLDFVLYGHIFESSSKKSLPPRTHQEVRDALSYDIPVVALGGINSTTINQLPAGFGGISAISAFMDASPNQITRIKEEWQILNLM